MLTQVGFFWKHYQAQSRKLIGSGLITWHGEAQHHKTAENSIFFSLNSFHNTKEMLSIIPQFKCQPPPTLTR